MWNRTYKTFKILHKKWKVLSMGRKMCHNHYFYPIHVLTFSMNNIFQETSEASCRHVLLYTEILSKREEILKLVKIVLAIQWLDCKIHDGLFENFEKMSFQLKPLDYAKNFVG